MAFETTVIDSLTPMLDQKPYQIRVIADPHLLKTQKQQDSAFLWDINLLTLPPDREQISTMFGSRNPRFLHVEVFFRNTQGLITTFGFKFSKPSPMDMAQLLITDESELVATMVNLSTEYISFGKFIEALDTSLTGGKGILLCGVPATLQIGIMDHWEEVKPCPIWKSGDSTVFSPEILKSVLKEQYTSSGIARSTLNLQLLQILYSRTNLSPVPNWVKIQCGSSNNQGTSAQNLYILDQQIILDILKKVLHFKA